MKTKERIREELDDLLAEYDEVLLMDEEEVCITFNADSKQEYQALLKEEIQLLESELNESSKPTAYQLELAGERRGYDYY